MVIRHLICFVRNFAHFEKCALRNCNSPSRLFFNSLCCTNLTKQYNLVHNLQIYRNKHSKKGKRPLEEDSDFDEDEEDWNEGSSDKISKALSAKVGSLRTDLILKAGLGMARNKVETAFYGSRIRVNGKKIFKKSVHVKDGDEIDVIRGFSPMNPDFLVVSRVEILSYSQREEEFVVKIRRSKSLTIENYEDPWKQNDKQE